MSTRPEIVTEAHLTYLDELRESGATNMFGSGSYVQAKFGVSKADAMTIVMYWMESFEERNPI